jgi:hypothetical protein
MPIIDQLDGSTPMGLSLEGQNGPHFEGMGQQFTSKIHARVDASGNLLKSQDLLTGRPSAFAPPSDPPVSFPDNFVGGPYYPSLGGPYSQTGPADGIY